MDEHCPAHGAGADAGRTAFLLRLLARARLFQTDRGTFRCVVPGPA